MSYFLTEEQELMRNVAREFAETEIKPNAKKLDETHEFPYDWVKRCAELDFMGVSIPEEYGGAGADCLSEMLVIEEISKYSCSLGLIIDVNTSVGCIPLLHFGTEEQKQKYLVPGAKGEKLLAFALTEPSAGSDAGGTKTTAVLDGNEWVINGSKCWITNSGAAGTYLVAAKTDPEKGNKGISAFIVEDGTPGFEIGKLERKMGINNTNTAQLFFKNCRIPKENLLGPLNKGFKVFLSALDEGRLAVGACAVGLAQGALDLAISYAKERIQFGKPICSFQGVSFKIADMAMKIEAARTMLYNAARLRDAGLPYTKESAMVKAYAAEVCEEVCEKALQIHGGNGYSKEFDIERYYRDAKILTIVEGTSEIQRMVIAGHLLR